jgi:hypothetical protein
MCTRLIGRFPAFPFASSRAATIPAMPKSGWSLPYLVQWRNRACKNEAWQGITADQGMISCDPPCFAGGKVSSFCEVCLVMTTLCTMPGPMLPAAKRSTSARTLASSSRV